MPAGYLYVDGIVGDVGRGVLRDRRVLAEEGVVVVVVTVDVKSGKVLARQEIITRGWVYTPEAEELLEEARLAVLFGSRLGRRRLRSVDPGRSVAGFVPPSGVLSRSAPVRRPMIVPVVMEV